MIDIRNAITFLQGEPGVDPARIGVWGVGVSGGHVVAVAAADARVKTGVAVMPVIPGKDTPTGVVQPIAGAACRDGAPGAVRPGPGHARRLPWR